MRRKRKLNKTESVIRAEKEMELFLKKVGYTGNYKGESVNKIPDYSTDNYQHTSNKIPAQGPKKQENTYTGSELSGIATTHKSNLIPIRRDNKQAAVDVATMRRS